MPRFHHHAPFVRQVDFVRPSVRLGRKRKSQADIHLGRRAASFHRIQADFGICEKLDHER